MTNFKLKVLIMWLS